MNVDKMTQTIKEELNRSSTEYTHHTEYGVYFLIGVNETAMVDRQSGQVFVKNGSDDFYNFTGITLTN